MLLSYNHKFKQAFQTELFQTSMCVRSGHTWYERNYEDTDNRILEGAYP